MTQKELNNRIAMSLLMQAAWVWEYCTINKVEGEFKLSEVCQGLYSRKRSDAKPGWTDIDMDRCQYWEHFADRIDGLKHFEPHYREVTIEFGTFTCSYLLKDVLGIARSWCIANACQSLMNNTVFGYKDGERYCRLPEVQVTQKAQKSQKPKKVSRKSAPKRAQSGAHKLQKPTAASRHNDKTSGTHPSIADQLRARLAVLLAA